VNHPGFAGYRTGTLSSSSIPPFVRLTL